MSKVKYRYRKFSDYLKDRYGCRVYKVGVNAGFSCPNRDGKKSSGGCIYCNNKTFGRQDKPVREQIEDGINFTRKRCSAEKHIIYFQSFTNTYATPGKLEKLYNIIREYSSVVGLSIGTRPDCIDNEKLDIVEKFCEDYEVWMEYGLQSINDRTLNFINRGHSYGDFLNAVKLTRKRKDIKISPHVIIGLPGETGSDFKKTAREMGRLKVDGIKIHPQHVVKDTLLEELYKNGDYNPPGFKDYTSAAADFLEYLWPDTVIQRITATCPTDMLLAPEWLNNTGSVIKDVNEQLAERKSRQGRLFSI
ncbi:MAG: TIGR01212 family radical SAM protein [Elusimicrobia bacterium]|jgi:radical SAM protein (TIGR01212 family)|nr:TIGR01212 family radical SAM protein [Elusimicrobiota bacterium]